jgi:hypothetical protein
MLPFPRHVDQWRELQRTIDALAFDAHLRAHEYEIVNVVDFFLLYINYVERDASEHYPLVRYFFRATGDRMLLVAPAMLEMDRKFRDDSRAIAPIDIERIDRFRRHPSAGRFVTAYESYKLSRAVTALNCLWQAYKELEAFDADALRHAVALSGFKTQRVRPVETIRNAMGSKKFAALSDIEAQLGRQQIRDDGDATIRAMRELQLWRPGRTPSNSTDAMVHGTCARLNRLALENGRKIFFRNATDGINAKVLWNQLADHVPPLPGHQQVAYCRDVRSLVMEALSLRRQAPGSASPALPYPAWPDWQMHLDTILLRQAALGAILGARRWCWRWAYSEVRTACGVDDPASWDGRLFFGDLEDAGLRELTDSRLRAVRRLGEALVGLQNKSATELARKKEGLRRLYEESLGAFAEFLVAFVGGAAVWKQASEEWELCQAEFEGDVHAVDTLDAFLRDLYEAGETDHPDDDDLDAAKQHLHDLADKAGVNHRDRVCDTLARYEQMFVSARRYTLAQLTLTLANELENP